MVVMYGFLVGFPNAPRRCIAVLLCSRRLSLFYPILYLLLCEMWASEIASSRLTKVLSACQSLLFLSSIFLCAPLIFHRSQHFVHHHLAMQSLLKVKAEDTGYHSLRRFTGRWVHKLWEGSSLSSPKSTIELILHWIISFCFSTWPEIH